MNSYFQGRCAALGLSLCLFLPPSLAAQAHKPHKPAIAHADYAQWRSIQGAVLSRDGRYAAYALVGQESDGELVVRRLADAQEWRAPRGAAPAFSADGRYLAFTVAVSQAAKDKARKDKKKPEDAPKPGAGLMDLATGSFTTVDRVKKFSWAEDGGTHLAVWLEAVKKEARKDAEPKADEDQEAPAGEDGPAKKKEAGSELLVIDAVSGTRHSVKDVAEYVWARHGGLLAYAVSVSAAPKEGVKDTSKPADAAREGVYVIQPGAAEGKALLSGAGSYRQLALARDGLQLAFVSNRDAVAEKGKDTAAFKLYAWREVDATATVVASSATAGMPMAAAPSEFGNVLFSRDGQRLFFGTAEVPKAEAKDAPEPMKVDLWHWKDPDLQSVQKVRAERDKQRSYKAVLHLAPQLADSRFVQLATPEMPEVVTNENADVGLGLSSLPYRMLQSWDALYWDAYTVDLQTGAARPLAQKLRQAPTLSPTGRYALAFEPARKTWSAWTTAEARKIDLTSRLGVAFENIERDVVEPAGPWGTAGWTEGDAAVVLYDQFDIWEVQPGSAPVVARNITAGQGRKQRLQLRWINLEPDNKEARALPKRAEQPWLLTGAHQSDRSSGFYQLGADGEVTRLIHGAKLYGGAVKAKNAQTLLFTQQSFAEFPDLWASTTALGAPHKISSANPQQASYRWGTQELIEYRSAKGKKLPALLAKPEGFDPRKKYPLMVYIYEKFSENLHRHIPPAPAQNINITRFVSNGYLVLRPDIVYEIGYPGRSALETVIPAIQQLIKAGLVDEKRIGIQGHSWGGYQIDYLITRTNIFAAAEGGAGMANMISGYGGIRWGAGVSRAFQYEQQQSRMGAAPWQRPDLYVENSPIFKADKVRTPLLTIHNDEDDAVPYYQAIEYFTALRRLGREVYWFNFNGAKHGLRDREHMKYFTVHMDEFFDHYLLGAARPEWMDKPVPYLERGKRDLNPIYKPQ